MKPVRLFHRRRDPEPPPLGYCRRFNQLDSHCPLCDTDEYCALARECSLVQLAPWDGIDAPPEE